MRSEKKLNLIKSLQSKISAHINNKVKFNELYVATKLKVEIVVLRSFLLPALYMRIGVRPNSRRLGCFAYNCELGS